MKKFNLGSVKMNTEENGLVRGFLLKRDVTVREARHIMLNIFGIVISTAEDLDNDELKYYNEELVKNLNEWLRGDLDDEYLMEYAFDCSGDSLGLMNLVPLICYLKKKDIID